MVVIWNLLTPGAVVVWWKISTVGVTVLAYRGCGYASTGDMRERRRHALAMGGLSRIGCSPTGSSEGVILRRSDQTSRFGAFQTCIGSCGRRRRVAKHFGMSAAGSHGTAGILSYFIVDNDRSLVTDVAERRRVRCFETKLSFLGRRCPAFRVISDQMRCSRGNLPRVRASVLPVRRGRSKDESFGIDGRRGNGSCFENFRSHFCSRVERHCPGGSLRHASPGHSRSGGLDIQRCGRGRSFGQRLRRRRGELITGGRGLGTVNGRLSRTCRRSRGTCRCGLRIRHCYRRRNVAVKRCRGRYF